MPSLRGFRSYPHALDPDPIAFMVATHRYRTLDSVFYEIAREIFRILGVDGNYVGREEGTEIWTVSFWNGTERITSRRYIIDGH
jgi:hypothetical protein